MTQSISITFTLYDEDTPEFNLVPVNERAENIAHFVSDELIMSGTIVEYEITNATLLD